MTQRKVMLSLLRTALTIDEIGDKIGMTSSDRRQRIRRTLDSLVPDYARETDAGFTCTALGYEIAVNVAAAIKEP